MMINKKWYRVLDGNWCGPYSAHELDRFYKMGKINDDTLLFSEQSENAEHILSVDELRDIVTLSSKGNKVIFNSSRVEKPRSFDHTPIPKLPEPTQEEQFLLKLKDVCKAFAALELKIADCSILASDEQQAILNHFKGDVQRDGLALSALYYGFGDMTSLLAEAHTAGASGEDFVAWIEQSNIREGE